jgi:nucleoside 2-deoxyribosyltransferase
VSEEENKKIAFIAAPFSTRFNPSNGIYDSDLRRTLETIISVLRLKGYLVRSSHIREHWGNKIMHPSEFVPLDYKSIKESDILLAYIDDCSTGLYIELGWASSLGKNILILLKADIQYSPMLRGLHNICKTEIFTFRDTKALLQDLDKVIDRALQS